MGTQDNTPTNSHRPLINTALTNAQLSAKPKVYTAEEIEDAYLNWYETPIVDRAEKNVSELSERTGMPVESFVLLQRQTFGAWLMTPEEQRLPPTKQELAANLGVQPTRLGQWLRDSTFAAADMRAAFRAKLLNRASEVAHNLAQQASSPLGGAPEIKLFTQLAGLSDAKADVNVNVQATATVYQGRTLTPEQAARIPEPQDEIIDLEPE